MANTHCAAPGNYAKVGLHIGLGPGKTELILPPLTDHATYTNILTALGSIVPHIVPGFSSCLGVPRPADNDPTFITATLENLGARHDRLLDLIEYVADDNPFATLRLQNVCGVRHFGHIVSAVPRPLVADFDVFRDDAVTSTFATI
jgi:hypothetical protein